MCDIVVTEDVSRLPIGWLKTDALMKMCDIVDFVVTADVSQLPIGWLGERVGAERDREAAQAPPARSRPGGARGRSLAGRRDGAGRTLQLGM